MNTKVNQSQSLRNVFGKFATGVSVVSFFDKNKNLPRKGMKDQI